MTWKITLHLIRMLALRLFASISLFLSVVFLSKEICFVIEWEILLTNRCSIVAAYLFDWISLMFMGFILFISGIVLFYRGSYMSGDCNLNRFIILVLAFVVSIIFLIIRPNLIRILLGWDGLGLVSYVLVIYYQNEKSANAGILTVLSNRVGDVAILLRIALIFIVGGWNFIFYVFYLSDEIALALKRLIIIAAITKRAQIPFSAWLPAAMAAPTPVSALVHSSTLVTAGVYLLIRFRPAILESKRILFLLLISSVTIFISGLGANFEYDLKKIIALSTLRQLGVMIRALGMGYPNLAFFHLLTHALFKALLFICAGAIIHNFKEYQDIRLIGNLARWMPLTCMCMNLANLALCGIPFLAGFYSKDIILEVAFRSVINIVIFSLYVVATMLTVCYTLRLVYYSITGLFNLLVYRNIDDSRNILTSPILALGMGAIGGGAALSWIIFPEAYIICLTPFIKRLVLLLVGLGGVTGYMLNVMSVNFNLISLKFYSWVVVSGSIWFISFLSTLKFSSIFLKGGLNYSLFVDKGWSEARGPQGVFQTIRGLSFKQQVAQDNTVKIFIKAFIVLAFLRLTVLVFYFHSLYENVALKLQRKLF